MIKLLVILQNAYGVDASYIPSFDIPTFANSQTGRRLKEMIPPDVELEIVNSTPRIGDNPDSCFPVDSEYVKNKIVSYNPDLILACGTNAKIVTRKLQLNIPIIETYHPAYRALSKNITKTIYEKVSSYNVNNSWL